jgi:uncharacterized protein YyaL (SSP411 family)
MAETIFTKETSHEPNQHRANRLAREKSPYLLQHANNPVDWYAWGDEAFEKAKEEDKPIFLSIGYSTCHWCHVMEKESFEDDETAQLMNDTFVSIKVDREERPDIDHVYMTVCQMMTGSGGWPLNIIMTPDRRPFFAGTYFPKESRYGRLGLDELSRKIKTLWTQSREQVLDSSEKIMLALNRIQEEPPGQSLGKDVLDTAFRQLSQRYDPMHGGFSNAPKFPTAHNMLFLLRSWKRSGDKSALHMVEHTLEAMRQGGIYDHVGFGFHRYSTDERWLVPHFEKMLYDQAMLAMTYTEAYQATGKEEYAGTAHEIFAYVLRDMTSVEGGFFSAEDADSEGVEGKFYVWTMEEIRNLLDSSEAELVVEVYCASDVGNFHEEATGQLTGSNILHMRQSLPQTASRLGMHPEELETKLDRAREKLFKGREKRIHPHKDDKILTDWNGLMIAALSKAAQVFDRPEYAEAAMKAADFVLATLREPDGRLRHRYRDGEAGLPAHVDDYAFMIWGLLELYEATFTVDYLKAALDLNKLFLQYFWDAERGGFYFTSVDGSELPVRKKEIYDGATPSGNSVAALNLLRLHRLTGDPEFEKMADLLGRAFSGSVNQFPSAYTQLLVALEFGMGPSHEIVITGRAGATDTNRLLKELRRPFLPNKVVLFRPSSGDSSEIADIAPYTRDQKTLDGNATAYVCANFSCEIPTSDPNKMMELLNR